MNLETPGLGSLLQIMTDDTNPKRAILGRVREALRQKSDSHVRSRSLSAGHELPVLKNTDEILTRRSEFLPPVGHSFDEQVALFRELSDRLQTEFKVVDSVDNAAAQIAKLAQENHWSRVAFHNHELVQSVIAGLDLELFSTDEPFDPHDLETCDVGISGCEALIAQTASVLVTSKSSGGRALSVLPPHHVVIATKEQMLGSMVDGFRLLHEKYGPHGWPSFSSFITGPSRTADVERVLVLGAHGPKRLTVLLI